MHVTLSWSELLTAIARNRNVCEVSVSGDWMDLVHELGFATVSIFTPPASQVSTYRWLMFTLLM